MEENQNPQLTPQQFAQKVKAKYPQYKDVDDVTLAKKMVEKYPEYAGQVNFNNVKKKRVFRAYCSRKAIGFSCETYSAKYFIGYRATNKSCGFGFFRWAN